MTRVESIVMLVSAVGSLAAGFASVAVGWEWWRGVVILAVNCVPIVARNWRRT